jgi:hypothetical protein
VVILSGLLRAGAPISGDPDTALGDWYVNRVVVQRQLCSYWKLGVVTPHRDPVAGLRSLPDRLATIVAARLHRRYFAADIIKKETHAMNPL